ncbi:hypothetical protein ARMSODRAFT_1013595, partial [Armillaria solidipes]
KRTRLTTDDITADSAPLDPPNNLAVVAVPTTAEVNVTKPKARKPRAKKPATEETVDAALPSRTESASGLVTDLVEKFLKKETDLSGLRGKDAAALGQLLDKQHNTFVAQKAVFEAQKAVFEAQKAASEAWKEAEDAKLKTMTYAKENDIPIQYSGPPTMPVETRTVMQPVQPVQSPQPPQPMQLPQPMMQYPPTYPPQFPMQYQAYAPAPAPSMSSHPQYHSVSAPPGA